MLCDMVLVRSFVLARKNTPMEGISMKLEVDDIAERFPKLASRVKDRRPMACIRMFCLHCMGGSQKEVKLCTCPDCPLYHLRLGRRRKAIGEGLELLPPPQSEQTAHTAPQLDRDAEGQASCGNHIATPLA